LLDAECGSVVGCMAPFQKPVPPDSPVPAENKNIDLCLLKR